MKDVLLLINLDFGQFLYGQYPVPPQSVLVHIE